MRTVLLLLFFFCLADGDDIRFEVNDLLQKFKSQVDGQLAALTLQISQLKSEVKKLKFHGPSAWMKFGDSSYYMSTEQKTWQESREYCQNEGADLVVINSREEKDFFDRLAGGNKWVWIGLTDSETEGVWKWADGTPPSLTTPTYWQSGEPNDSLGGEDCAAAGVNGGWYDLRCYTTRYWMCEIVL